MRYPKHHRHHSLLFLQPYLDAATLSQHNMLLNSETFKVSTDTHMADVPYWGHVKGNSLVLALTALVASHGLEDALPHFRQRSCRHGQGVTWWQRRADVGIVCLANCDYYLLASDRRFLRNVQIQQPRLRQSDHFALIGVVPSPLLAQR